MSDINKKVDVMEEGGEAWLKTNWPNARKVDYNWTMERYDYPDFVRNYIKTHWVKVSDDNGGTYAEPVWWQERKGNKYLK